MSKKFYGIRRGLKSNVVVDTWSECEQLVRGFKGAVFKGFNDRAAAKAFAKSGNYGKHTPKIKPANQQFDPEKYPCILRKTYRDTTTGVLYKNRCVIRQGPTVIGADFKPHIGNSVPWRES